MFIMRTVNVMKSVAGFSVDRALAAVFLTHFEGCETFHYLRGSEREEREHN